MNPAWFLYGTAWKEDDTQRLVGLALHQGFRGVDAANQRKHYYEAAVGMAIQTAVQSGLVKREDLFLQTKFTFRRGQDHRLPYDPKAPIARQVEQSLQSSLEHFGAPSIDSYVLHGPSQGAGLGKDDWEAWRAMEALHDAGKAKALGISNVNLEQLELLVKQARVKPAWVQNRCYAVAGWDYLVRVFCREHGVAYQGFSLLTANVPAVQSGPIAALAKKYGRSPAQIVFRFAVDVGMAPLTGTTDPQHMREDLAVAEFKLEPSEVDAVERIAGRR